MHSWGALSCGAILLVQCLALVSAQGSTAQWQTLSGDLPKVIARGGFSGLLPDSSHDAYQFAMIVSVSDVVLWCDVQLTKDGVGICAPDLKLDNSTNIGQIYPNQSKEYLLNGVPTRGWFSLDFTLNQLTQVALIQGVNTRNPRFDGNLFPIQTVLDVATTLKPAGLWLNIQHDAFYTQHNLSMGNFVLSASKNVTVDYISSPEIGFLKSMGSRFNPNITKLVFRLLEPNDIEPTTNQTYGSLLSNLTSIKTFASGILLSKNYIWPVDATLYLQPHTSLVSDAHKAGLEVFASEFYNDVPFSYNFSYNPVTEQLYFIDNGDFSVDGVLSDFPITASEARDCFSHLGKNASEQVNLLVISKNGASGDYPGCTDLAYQKAISDGADVIDCNVQMSQDGIPFCLSSINLMDTTTVAQTSYINSTTSVPEIQQGSGIFTFSLTWNQIKTLTPSISNPCASFFLYRNPKYKNAGNFLTLSDFLALAKDATSLSGVLINIENARYLIEKQSLPVIDAVLDALNKAGYDNQTDLKVMIQSPDSSVLMKFKEKNNYELVYKVDENIGDVLASTIEDIKTFADSVVISKTSVFPLRASLLTGTTDVVARLQSSKLPVYVELLSNEFVTQAWDFFSDATVEVNSYFSGAAVNGVVTDFPQTSASYKRNRCLNLGDKTPAYMMPVEPGSLLHLVTPEYLPPAEAPNPALTVSDVAESPLPSVTPKTPPPSPGGGAAESPKPANGQPKVAVCVFLSHLAMLFTILLLV